MTFCGLGLKKTKNYPQYYQRVINKISLGFCAHKGEVGDITTRKTLISWVTISAWVESKSN